MLVAIEGIDGSGKATLTRALAAAWADRGLAQSVLSFPRYGKTPLANAVSALLASPHLLESCGPRGSALVFAAERTAARSLLVRPADELIVVDRYVASNAVYQSARELTSDAAWATLEWIFELEFAQLSLPVPDLTVLVDVPVEESLKRLVARQTSLDLGDRPPSDEFERDTALLRAAAEQYRRCAQAAVWGRWLVVDGRASVSQSVSHVLGELTRLAGS